MLPFNEFDIFRGFFEEDVPRIQALRAPSAPASDPAAYIDAVGVKTTLASCFWISPHLGKVETDIPLVEHPMVQEGIEYAALGLALDYAAGRDTFTVAEIGAGWGPWASTSAIAARRRFPNVGIIALEADPRRFEMLRQHLEFNGLYRADGGSESHSSCRLVQAAIGVEDGVLYWPANTKPEDAGAAAVSDQTSSKDYRGVDIETVAVRALSFATAFEGVERVDFLHIDIQGAEHEVIPASLEVLTQKAKCMFIGTHSRKIEGDFIAQLADAGWRLIREKPCQFYHLAEAPTLVGLTYFDGGQFWMNPSL